MSAVEMVAAIALTSWAAGAAMLGWRRQCGLLPIIMGGIVAAGALVLVASTATPPRTSLEAIGIGALAALVGHLAVSLPDGRVLGRRWAAVLVVYGIGAVLAVGLVRSEPGSRSWMVWLGSLAIAGVSAPVVLARCRDADLVTRARLQWIGAGGIGVLTIGTIGWALHQLTGWPADAAIVLVAGSVLVPGSLVVADLGRTAPLAAATLVHTIVASGLVLVATMTYLVIVIGFDGTPTEEQRPALAMALVATAIIAVAALPARRALERLANQRVYGEREAPEAALQTLSGRMTRAVPLDELLLQLAETLKKSLPAQRAEVWTGTDGTFDLAVAVPGRDAPRLSLGIEERRVAARTQISGNGWLDVWVPALTEGRSEVVVRAAPIAHLGELFGFVVAERSPDGAEFGEDEDRALTDIARQLGLALHNARLDTALQASLNELQLRNTELVASRARIVASADESRRRIERDLHDGAQQHLVAMAVKLGVTRQLLDSDPAALPELLEQLREDVQVTLTELRELAHGIYPPLLRSRGLPEALGAAANRATIPTTVEVTQLPRFDPDVEAAVYFCCLEAMQNASKHAGEQARVTVNVEWSDEVLSFTVCDDGTGFDPDLVDGGVGFVNMADRLGARGGALTVTSAPGAGTTIAGQVPQVAAVE